LRTTCGHAEFRHVKTTECVNGLIDDALGASVRTDVVGVGDSLAASGLDFISNVLSRSGVAATTVARCTEVVNHDKTAV